MQVQIKFFSRYLLWLWQWWCRKKELPRPVVGLTGSGRAQTSVSRTAGYDQGQGLGEIVHMAHQ